MAINTAIITTPEAAVKAQAEVKRKRSILNDTPSMPFCFRFLASSNRIPMVTLFSARMASTKKISHSGGRILTGKASGSITSKACGAFSIACLSSSRL
jgi:hypothetical protein